jgi:hypothetical protein
MPRIESVTAGIAPSPRVDIGPNVFRAVASYAGKPLAILRDGRSTAAYALLDTQRFTIALPGRLPLLRRRFTLVDAPDLAVLPTLFPSLKTAWAGVGTVPAILHRALSALAWLVRLRVLRSLVPFADRMHRASRLPRWGEHRGGMFVSVAGAAADGSRISREWHMIAEADDGPFVPAMAAAAIIRRCIDGHRPAAGARAGTGDVQLADYEAQFASRRIFAGVREEITPPLRLTGAFSERPSTACRRRCAACTILKSSAWQRGEAPSNAARDGSRAASPGRSVSRRQPRTFRSASRSAAGRPRDLAAQIRRCGIFQHPGRRARAIGSAVVRAVRPMRLWDCAGR